MELALKTKMIPETQFQSILQYCTYTTFVGGYYLYQNFKLYLLKPNVPWDNEAYVLMMERQTCRSTRVIVMA